MERTKTVFVLGAGFSTRQGVPLARDLRPEVERFLGSSESDWYRDFCEQYKRWVSDVDPRSELGFEELVSKMEKQLQKSAKNAIAFCLRNGVARYLWSLHREWITPQDCYLNFAEWVRPEQGRISKDVVVSFNWDVVAEVALRKAKIPFDYGRSGGVSVLKPHGSINWKNFVEGPLGRDLGDGWCRTAPGSRFVFNKLRPLEDPFSIDGDELDAPVAVYPGDEECPQEDKDVNQIWSDVKEALDKCDRAVFIGYSLPEYDARAVEVFREKLGGSGIQVEVIDPSPKMQERYRNCLSANVVDSAPGTFEECPYAKRPDFSSV